MMERLLVLLLCSCFAHVVYTLDNGLARTPPMGWMAWERFRCIIDCETYPEQCISENLFMDMADRITEDGYRELGYEYVMIDDCWSEKHRDSNQRLQPDKKRFPSGIKALADYIHAKGLKFGIYADYGTLTCGGYPGSLGYLEKDAQTFADWGVDYLKFDACYSELLKNNYYEGYAEMSSYLNGTGRPIVFSCSYPAYLEPDGKYVNYTEASTICNLWRNYDDIQDSWQSTQEIMRWFADNQDRLQPVAAPGHWNDPDMLIAGNYGLSYEQSKTQLGIWALMAAPFIMSVDLRNIDPKFSALYKNTDLVAIDQDALGIQGRRILKLRNKHEIWMRPVLPIVSGSPSYAIGIFGNRTDGYPVVTTFTLHELNVTYTGGFNITSIFEDDHYSGTDINIHDNITVAVPPSGLVLLKATPLDMYPGQDTPSLSQEPINLIKL